MVREDSKTTKVRPVCYLPHKPVVREDSKTTKVRPVLDASAKGHDGVSSNDCIEAEPNLFPNLLDVLTRGGSWKMALVADIKKSVFTDKGSKRRPKCASISLGTKR